MSKAPVRCPIGARQITLLLLILGAAHLRVAGAHTCTADVYRGLTELYWQTGGDANWRSEWDEDPCDGKWTEVDVSEGKIVKINLDGKDGDNTGTLPSEIGLLTDLTEFSFKKMYGITGAFAAVVLSAQLTVQCCSADQCGVSVEVPGHARMHGTMPVHVPRRRLSHARLLSPVQQERFRPKSGS